MAKRKAADKEPRTAPSLEILGVDDAVYMLSVSLEKFDLKKFVAAAGGKKHYNQSGGLVFASRDPESGAYYVRMSWYVLDQEMRLRIEYIQGKRQHADDEKPPYAEEFMAWLGAFFKYSSAQSHTHAHLAFPIKSWRSRFPLPLRTAMVGDPEIDGISLRLPTKPDGISKVRINMGTKLWRLEIVADKRLTFTTFSINEDIASYASALRTLMEEIS